MIRKLPLVLLLTSLFVTLTMSAQLYEVPLDRKIQNSSLIVEGRVVEQHSFWNEKHTMIFTSNKIEVFKIFKGAMTGTHIEVMTPGGTVNDTAIQASDLISLVNGEIGIFFCYPNLINLRSPQTNKVLYDIWASSQGCFKYDNEGRMASAPFVHYVSVEEQLYPELQLKTGRAYTNIKPSFSVAQLRPAPGPMFRPQATVTSFSPASVVAGAISDAAQNVLTINGSGFGTPTALARVEFDDPDNGSGGAATTGSTIFADPAHASGTADYVISWTPTQIVLRVPAKTGTGFFTVYDNAGSPGTSPTALDVKYANLTIGLFVSSPRMKMITLVDRNTTGGYTYFYSNVNGAGAIDFALSTSEPAFARAMATWKERYGVNFVFGGAIANQVVNAGNVGDNTIMLDNNNTGTGPLADGVLAVCWTSANACSGSFNAARLGFDIVIRNPGVSIDASGNFGFNDGPCRTVTTGPPFIIDMETVCLHEIGHAINLGHINDGFVSNNPSKVMHFAVVNGRDRRSPDWSAASNAIYSITPKGFIYNCPGLMVGEMVPLGGTIIESKDECPVTFPSTTTPSNTVVAFDLVHATSNKNVDPAHTQFGGGSVGITNTAYYAIRTKPGGGVLNISVSGYTTTPATQAACSNDGIELAVYQVSTCPAGESFPAAFATRAFTGNGSLATITGLASNTNYLIVVDGAGNTKANFSLTLNGSALPIHLLSFTGRKVNTTSVLEWQTGSEYNNAYFEIQTSKDGITYYTIGRVNSHGNSTTTQSYAFTDRLPISGANYYRLKQVDIDGHSTLSNIVLLNFTDKGRPMIVYPNPAADNLTFEISKPSTNVQARILATDGKLVRMEKLSAVQRNHELDITSLSSGSYILEITTDNNVVQYARFVKQ